MIERQLERIIQEYEQGKVSYDEVKTLVFDLTGKSVDRRSFDNYWTSEDLETFIRRLAMQSIPDWQQIDDEKSIRLIREIQENIGDSAISERNGEALEKRYGKPEGTVSDYIYNQDMVAPEQLLELLKKDTRIIL